jgi:hypothetical protein
LCLVLHTACPDKHLETRTVFAQTLDEITKGKTMSTTIDANDVARGVSRYFLRNGLYALAEVPLSGNRRADLVVLDARGQITIIEIKVSRADLLGDGKWPEYLPHCDRYFWAVPNGFDLGLLDRPELRPELTGLLVADRYDAAIVRDAVVNPLAAARRKAETLNLSRLSMRRIMALQAVDDGLAF